MSSDNATRPWALRVEGVGKSYTLGQTEGFFRYRSLRDDIARGVRRRLRGEEEQTSQVWALRDVSFSLREGETLGVIGHNGAGKSTLFKILSRVTPPTEGRAEVRGRLGSLLEVGTGFHPELSGRENIFLSGSVLGMRRSEIVARLDEIVDFAGVEKFLDTPVKRYSSGMFLRLAFAVAAHLEPEILLVDEVLSVGDAQFQRKCLGKMAEVGASGRTVLFVSHSMPAVLRLCQRIILLDHGHLIADGPAPEVVRKYLDSGSGTPAVREWDDPRRAPGDAVARLAAVRITDDSGRAVSECDIRKPLRIEVDYWNLGAEPDNPLTANIHLYNEEGVLLFASADFTDRDWWSKPRVRGRVGAVCHLPGNFLAEGHHYVTVNVSSLSPPYVHASEKEAVVFHVVDRSEGEGARGDAVYEWPGVVRPLLHWEVAQEASAATLRGVEQ